MPPTPAISMQVFILQYFKGDCVFQVHCSPLSPIKTYVQIPRELRTSFADLPIPLALPAKVNLGNIMTPRGGAPLCF